MNKETKNYFLKLASNPNADPVVNAELEAGEFNHVPGFPGLLSREAALTERMDFRIPRWEDFSSDPGAPDTVRVFMKPADASEYGEPILTFTHFFDAATPAADVVVDIVRGRRPPGQYDIKYDVFIVRIPNRSESDPARLIVDLEAPYATSVDRPPAPIPPPGLTLPLDRSDFPAAPDDRVWFSIPDYVSFGRAPGDTLRLYYNGADLPYLPEPPAPGTEWPVTDLRFPLPLSVVESGPDGFINLTYELLDAAGNPSRLSLPYRLDVALMPAPTNLLQPLINRAFPGDHLIDRQDTSLDNGIIVRIPAYSDFQRGNEGDYFNVTLSTSLGSLTVSDFPLGSNSFPVQIPVDYTILAALYGATEGLLALTVAYEIKRRSVTYPAPVATTVDLDLYVVGPTPTDPPDQVNSNLFPVIVRGEDAGGTEGNDNELLPEHANRPANAYIELWDQPPTPDDRPFTIYLWYEGELANTLPVPTGMANQIVPMQIPWSLISKHGNAPPGKTVYYTIGAAGSTNRQYSPTTLVDVQANIRALDPPQVRNLEMGGGPPGLINCNSIRPLNSNGNVTVFIPPSDLFERFMVVRLEWQGYSDNAGTVAVAAAYGFKDSIPLTATMIALGFELDLGPFSTIMKLIQPDLGSRLTGSARVNYTLQTVEGPLVSADALHLSRAIKAGTNPTYCDNTPVPLAL